MALTTNAIEWLSQYLRGANLGGTVWVSSDEDCAYLFEGVAGLTVHCAKTAPGEGVLACSVVVTGAEPFLFEPALEAIAVSKARPVLCVYTGESETGLPSRLRDRILAMGYIEQVEDSGKNGFTVFLSADFDHKQHFDVASYWEKRYAAGRNSGSGSYGRLARFKARFLNAFVEENEVETVLELGCGDGAQLSLAQYPMYYGLDISQTVVDLCKKTFEFDPDKQFALYDPEAFRPQDWRADLALSLDVVYHLSNDGVYRHYLDHLFSASQRFVIVYSNSEEDYQVGVDESAGYVRFRDFISDVAEWYPDWHLVAAIPNRYPFSALNPTKTSFADFFVFEKTPADVGALDKERLLERFSIKKIINSLSVADENDLLVSKKQQEVDSRLKDAVKTLERVSKDSVTSREQVEKALGKRLEHAAQLAESAAVGRHGELLQLVSSSQLQLGKSVAELEQAVGAISPAFRSQLSALASAHQESEKRLLGEASKLSTRIEQVEGFVQCQNEQLLQKFERRLLAATLRLSERSGSSQPPSSSGYKALVGAADAALAKAKQESARLDGRVAMLEASTSYRLGKAFVDAIKRPGINTLKFPVRLLRALRRPSRKKSQSQAAASLEKARLSLSTLRAGLERSDDKSAGAAWVSGVSLGQEPFWLELAPPCGAAVNIEVALRCEGEKPSRRKGVVALIECLDQQGARVAGAPGKLAFSDRLDGYFKYVAHQDDIGLLHSFVPPDGTRYVLVGFRVFCPSIGDRYTLERVAVTAGATAFARPVDGQKIQRDVVPDAKPKPGFNPPSRQAQELSILGWPAPEEGDGPLVLAVMDEFTQACFSNELRLLQPRPDNWYALAEKYKPEFIFIESAWKGNYGSWQYRVADYANKPGQEIEHICQYAREKGIPTLFWNKEDPVHHQKFMCSAKLVDHIFTTDANMKGSYQAKTGNPNVHALPFAAQPALHKPAPLAGRKPRACFAGSWYGNRHAERGEAMRWLLQAANRHGLDIYDRNHGTGIFPFPEEYQAGIKGSLPYRELCDEYSRYRVFLNVNSVTESPTMFSRRVFELMACGTPVVSTYAKGIENLFESDAVWLVNSQDEADEALHTLMTDDAEWRRRSLAGIREVFARHTYAHRLKDILDCLGLESRVTADPAVALVTEAHSSDEFELLQSFARKQSYSRFQLGIACAQGLAEQSASLAGNITLLQPGQAASWLTEDQANTRLMGWLSPHHSYGEHYLRDLVNASLYQPEAAGWGKALGCDRFAYEGDALIGGTVWRENDFLQKILSTRPDERISRPDLFLADCDQFQPVSAPDQSVEAQP